MSSRVGYGLLSYSKLLLVLFILLFGPKAISTFLTDKFDLSWSGSSELIFVGLIGVLTLLGTFVSTSGSTLLILTSLVITFLLLKDGVKELKLFPLLASIGFSLMLSVYMAMMLTENGRATPYFLQDFIAGELNVDTVFHCALAYLFDTYRTISTAYNGIVDLPYHAFSNMFVSSLSELTQIGRMDLYNGIAFYIIIPLFLCSIIECARHVSHQYFNLDKYSYGVVLIFTSTLFFNNAYLFRCAFVHLNLLFSIVLLLHLFMFLSKHYDKNRVSVPIHIFIFLFITIITYTKLSSGFHALVMYGAFNLKYFELSPKSVLLKLILLGLLVFFVFRFVLIPQGSWFVSASFAKSTYRKIVETYWRFWRNGQGFLYYSSGFMMTAIYLFNQKVKSFKDIKEAIWSNLFVATLLLMSISGLVVGILYYTFNWYFLLPSIIFSIIYIAVIVSKYWTELDVKKSYKMSFLILVGALNFISQPTMIKKYKAESKKLQKSYKKIVNTKEKNVLTAYCAELEQLDRIENKRELAIYVHKDEDWLYKSQKSKHSPLLITQALTGIAMIGATDGYVKRGRHLPYFGLQLYNKLDEVNNLEDAISVAKSHGYSTLLSYSADNNELRKEVITLD